MNVGTEGFLESVDSCDHASYGEVWRIWQVVDLDNGIFDRWHMLHSDLI
jgi:hypothetical protein